MVTTTTKSSDEVTREQLGLAQGGSCDVAACLDALGTCNVAAGGPPVAEGSPRAASTACVGVVAAGGPPAAVGRPRAAGTACNACVGTPPVAIGMPHVASTTCGSFVPVGGPPAA